MLCVSLGLLITPIHFADSTCLLSSPNVSTASSLETLIAGTLQPWHNHSTILAQMAQGLHNVLLYYSTLLAHCLHFLVDSLLFWVIAETSSSASPTCLLEHYILWVSCQLQMCLKSRRRAVQSVKVLEGYTLVVQNCWQCGCIGAPPILFWQKGDPQKGTNTPSEGHKHTLCQRHCHCHHNLNFSEHKTAACRQFQWP